MWNEVEHIRSNSLPKAEAARIATLANIMCMS